MKDPSTNYVGIKTLLGYWKEIIGFITLIVVSTVGIIAYAEDQKQLIRAEQQLIHNELYQESRITRKKDQIKENKRELTFLESFIGDDEPTPREERKILALMEEIRALEKDIEEIEVLLNTNE